MKRGFEPDPEEELRRGEASVLMLRVGLAMIDDARHAGGFETVETKLAARIQEILESLNADESPYDERPVTVTPIDAERVHLTAPFDKHHWDGAVLRTDGVLLEEYTALGIGLAEKVDPAELSPQEQEDLREARERHETRMRRPQFHGGRFLRALAAESQPGSEVQILAVELFDGGLIVHFSHNDFEVDSEDGGRSGAPETFDLRIGIRVEDDLGTDYRESGGSAGGVQVVHGAITFAPAVPPEAHLLRVTGLSGAVELTL